MTGGEQVGGGFKKLGPSAPPALPSRLVLGFERIGLIALRAPLLSILAVIVLAGFAAIGVRNLKVDDSLTSLFRSETPQFRHFEEFTRRFPSNEYDVFMVVEGDDLLARNSIDALRNVVTELQLLDAGGKPATRGVLSLFSARQPPENGTVPGPLFPADLPEGKAYEELIHRVLSNEIIRGKLLSEDGKLALVVIALDPAIANGETGAKFGIPSFQDIKKWFQQLPAFFTDLPGKARSWIAGLSGGVKQAGCDSYEGLQQVICKIRAEAKNELEGTGVKVELSGVPVMRLEIRNAVERDETLYN